MDILSNDGDNGRVVVSTRPPLSATSRISRCVCRHALFVNRFTLRCAPSEGGHSDVSWQSPSRIAVFRVRPLSGCVDAIHLVWEFLYINRYLQLLTPLKKSRTISWVVEFESRLIKSPIMSSSVLTILCESLSITAVYYVVVPKTVPSTWNPSLTFQIWNQRFGS